MITIRDTLFLLLRHALWGGKLFDGQFSHLTKQDWEELYKLSSRQGVLAIVYDGWRNLPSEVQPPSQLKISWALNTEKIEASYARQIDVAKELFALCHKDGIAPILLKGIALSRFYPVPEHRPCGDIDIWLGEQSDRCNERMRQQGVVVNTDDNEKHAVFWYRSVMIENHHTFVDVEEYTIDRTLEDYLIREATHAENCLFAGVQYLTLPATADALFLLRHTARHLERGIGLRHLCDWVLFLQANSKRIDWVEFDRIVGMLHLDVFAAVVNGIACDTMGLSSALLPPFERQSALQTKVLDYILHYQADRIETKNPIRILQLKYRRMMCRRWIHQRVLCGSFVGYIWRSVKFHLRHPKTILIKEM